MGNRVFTTLGGPPLYSPPQAVIFLEYMLGKGVFLWKIIFLEQQNFKKIRPAAGSKNPLVELSERFPKHSTGRVK